ncbi:hypothetical protein EYF80_028863 [Liparis tanakae]|uniref:Uncharacterized protein n=1 Tax=Liparis tanakae TaxID=230148 RepID=A0A4Z2H4T4_9TELE|nr:hypothetical protein EYF80_028863 [Liparis tanakae]
MVVSCESCRSNVKQNQNKPDVPDETEALDTEIVGVPEFVLLWPVAFFSGVLSLEFTLATLSAPSGCGNKSNTPEMLKRQFKLHHVPTLWKTAALKHPKAPLTGGHQCGVMDHRVALLNGCFNPGKTLHSRDLGTHVASPRGRFGSRDAAVVADAQLALLAQISAAEDQAQTLQAASALPLLRLLGPTGPFPFDLQQLILQLPAGEKDDDIKAPEENSVM